VAASAASAAGEAAAVAVAEDFRVAGAGDKVVEVGKAAVLARGMTAVRPGVATLMESLALNVKPTG
jgi:hypothetical protein